MTISKTTKTLLSHSHKVEEVINGVDTVKMEDEDEKEVKQSRVSKAQKRRVRYMFHFEWNNFKSHLLLHTTM